MPIYSPNAKFGVPLALIGHKECVFESLPRSSKSLLHPKCAFEYIVITGHRNSNISSTMIMPTVTTTTATTQVLSQETKSSMVTATTIRPTQTSNRMSTSTPIECAGCGTSIIDRYYMSADDRHWHGSCLKCSHCKSDLQEETSCFQRDGRIFCKSDYYRMFSMRRCSRCGEGIYASELVMRVRDQNVYHIQCFTCAWCNVTLSQGDLYGLRDNLVYCRNHYEMLSSTSPGFSASSSIISLGPQSSSHNEMLMPGHHLLHSSHNSSPLQDSITADACSALAATPYASSSLYSPLNLGGISSNLHGPSSRSPSTPQNIRKGRPRKRKNNDHHTNESMINTGSSCSHDPSMSPNVGSSQSPGNTNSLDGGPLSGLAASIENSCLGGSQLPSSGLSLGSHSSQRTKRMRTSFKHHQLRTMKTYFNINQNPDAKDLKQLSQKTGLSKRVLQVWFQNARAKWRRNNLKMLPDGQELTMNGQTLLTLGHPSTPSTVIGSPNGSTRPFSSPSPVMSPPGETMCNSHQSSLGPSQTSLHSQSSAIESFSLTQSDPGLLPINFQELY